MTVLRKFTFVGQMVRRPLTVIEFVRIVIAHLMEALARTIRVFPAPIRATDTPNVARLQTGAVRTGHFREVNASHFCVLIFSSSPVRKKRHVAQPVPYAKDGDVWPEVISFGAL